MSIRIRTARDTVKRRSQPAQLALIVAVLLLVSSGSMVFGAGFDEYIIGSGGEFECFPEYEYPNCEGAVSNLSEGNRPIYAVLGECGARIEDKSILQKFVMADSGGRTMFEPFLKMQRRRLRSQPMSSPSEYAPVAKWSFVPSHRC